MALPLVLGAMAAKKVYGAVKGRTSAAKKAAGPKTHRRRRKHLTATNINELMHIKNLLGKTAAANALPFYLK